MRFYLKEGTFSSYAPSTIDRLKKQADNLDELKP